jgi:citrate lyase beta subunit
VLPGHEWEERDVARVVERHPRYFVVEKLDEAAETAIDQDPRSEA